MQRWQTILKKSISKSADLPTHLGHLIDTVNENHYSELELFLIRPQEKNVGVH